MPTSRRTFLQLFAAGLGLVARRSWGVSQVSVVPVDAGAFARAMAEETGQLPVTDSEAVLLEAPLIAENGAIVPITVETTLAGVKELVILAERNPTPVVARFNLDPSLDPFVSLRIKLNESGEVVALAKTATACFAARRRVQVTVGGCG